MHRLCTGGIRWVNRAAAAASPPDIRTEAEPALDMTDLKLIALDAEDLSVVSAHLQDAILKVEDMAWMQREQRFAAVLNRFDWAAALAAEGQSRRRRRPPQRRRTALRFERVTAAKLQGIDPKARERVLVLLAVGFETGDRPPAGSVTLQFAGGAAIRLDVECIEAEMRDLGARWMARSQPDHGKE